MDFLNLSKLLNTFKSLDKASEQGNLVEIISIIEGLEPNPSPEIEDYTKRFIQIGLQTSCINGHLACVQYYLEKQTKFTAECDILRFISGGGHIHLAQYALTIGHELEPSHLEPAAFEGHLHFIQWALEKGCQWTPKVVTNAASRGNLQIIQWAKENGYYISTSAMNEAALLGSIEMVKYLHYECGFPLTEMVAKHFTRKCNFEALQWLKSIGGDIPYSIFYSAEDIKCLLFCFKLLGVNDLSDDINVLSVTKLDLLTKFLHINKNEFYSEAFKELTFRNLLINTNFPPKYKQLGSVVADKKRELKQLENAIRTRCEILPTDVQNLIIKHF